MKKVIGWVISLFELVVGLVLFVMAQSEISTNSWYTWRQPYTSYEAQVIMMKWIGIILLISGIIWIALLLFRVIYTNKHTQDITVLTQKGGSLQCVNCGLAVAANLSICPRCGKSVRNAVTNESQADSIHFCPRCGSQINNHDSSCPKCGNQTG